MAYAEQIGAPEEDMWEIVGDDGVRRRADGYTARQTHPEAFPAPELGTSYVDQSGAPPWTHTQPPERPPWEQVPPEPEVELAPVQDAAFMQDGAIPAMDAGVEMGEPEQWRPPGAPAPGVSMGRSVSYSGPVGGYVEGQSPGLPSFDPQREQYQEGADIRKQGIEDLRGATGRYDEAQAQNYEDIAAERVDRVRQQQEMYEFSRQQVEAKEQELNQARQAISRMDMNKVWKDTDASAKFAGLMAAGIAGWLNPTGKNSVVEQMSDLMDKSAREQAANIATEKYQLEGQERELGRFEQREREEQSMYLANRVLLAENLKDKITQEAAKYQSAITLGKLAELEGGIEQDMAKDMMAWEQNEWNNANAMYQANEQRKNARALARMRIAASERQATQARSDSLRAAALSRGQMITSVPGLGAIYAGKDFKPTEKQRNKATDVVKIGYGLKRSLTKMADLIATHGKNWGAINPTSELGKNVRALHSELLQQLRSETGANLTKMEAKLVRQQYGDLESLFNNPEHSTGIIRGALGTLEYNIGNELAPMGAQYYPEDAEELPVQLPDGSVVMVPQPSNVQRGVSAQGDFELPPHQEIAPAYISRHIDEIRLAKDKFYKERDAGASEQELQERRMVVQAKVDNFMERAKETRLVPGSHPSERGGRDVDLFDEAVGELGEVEGILGERVGSGSYLAELNYITEAAQEELRLRDAASSGNPFEGTKYEGVGTDPLGNVAF